MTVMTYIAKLCPSMAISGTKGIRAVREGKEKENERICRKIKNKTRHSVSTVPFPLTPCTSNSDQVVHHQSTILPFASHGDGFLFGAHNLIGEMTGTPNNIVFCHFGSILSQYSISTSPSTRRSICVACCNYSSEGVRRRIATDWAGLCIKLHRVLLTMYAADIRFHCQKHKNVWASPAGTSLANAVREILSHVVLSLQ